MSTHELLTQAVMISGRQVLPQLGMLEEVAETARQIAPELRSAEEKQILRISKVARKNLPLINLVTAIQAGGLDARGLPRLALSSYRMSQNGTPTQVVVIWNGAVEFRTTDWSGEEPWSIRLPEGTLPEAGFLTRFLGITKEAQTATPAVPADLRQKNPRGVILLFEAPLWEPVRIPNGDPYLLRHVAGNVYAVLGTWDITDLEVKAFNAARDLGLRS